VGVVLRAQGHRRRRVEVGGPAGSRGFWLGRGCRRARPCGRRRRRRGGATPPRSGRRSSGARTARRAGARWHRPEHRTDRSDACRQPTPSPGTPWA
jgi:hypothetical protein